MARMSLEAEQFLDEIVGSGRFPSRQEAIEEAIQLLRREIQQNGQMASDSLTASQWCERFERWAATHRPLVDEADDSRESIYSDRGE
jgi:Arc/MetJ-type ribon-helix-helix transcriptional regulator